MTNEEKYEMNVRTMISYEEMIERIERRIERGWNPEREEELISRIARYEETILRIAGENIALNA
jgi:hypothetical protein